MKDSTKIKRLNISHYGPLRDIDLDFENGFNAFYGRNESGKTLIVEAMNSLLSGKENARISQSPNGFMKIEKDGELFDAENDEISDFMSDVTPEDIRNAFIIRDADLRRPERSNSFKSREYYRDVTDRVLGSRTQKIESLRDEIAELGFLTNSTSNGKLENTRSTGKLSDRLDDAQKLLDEISDFTQKTRSSEIYSKFTEVERLNERIENQKELIEKIKNKEKQEKHSRGLSLIKEVEEADERIESLEKEERELNELKEIKRKAEEFEELNEDTQTLKYSASGSGILSGLSLLALAINPGILAAIVSVVFLATSVYTAYSYRKVRNRVNENMALEESIIEDARSRGLKVDSIQEVILSVDDYEKEVKDELEKQREERNEALGELKGKFDRKANDLNGWRNILEEFSDEFDEQDEEFDKSVEESREELKRLEEEQEKIKEEISTHREKLEEFDEKFSNIVKQSFINEEKVEVESLQDLEKASSQLKAFIDSLEEEVDTSRKAIEILEDMEEEEGDEFNKIFEDESYATEMFREATENNYTDISFEKDSQEIEVTRSDGKKIRPDELSQGTYDLLYMCIRLALAREILGRPGFIVLDNAFTHSDIQRIERELEFLKKLEKDGWQIIYLTFRDDVREKLEAFTDVRHLDRLDY